MVGTFSSLRSTRSISLLVQAKRSRRNAGSVVRPGRGLTLRRWAAAGSSADPPADGPLDDPLACMRKPRAVNRTLCKWVAPPPAHAADAATRLVVSTATGALRAVHGHANRAKAIAADANGISGLKSWSGGAHPK